MGARINSMTGFARIEGAHESWRWTWELKSVNGRGLEMRMRTPAGFDQLDPALRKTVQTKLRRGSLSINLSLRGESAEPRYQINEQALLSAIAMVEKISAHIKCEPPRAEGLLALRGVIEAAPEDETGEERKRLIEALLASFEEGVDALNEARASEGAGLSTVIAAHFREIEQLTKAAADLAAGAPEALRKKIAGQLDELLAGGPLPEERLAQEAALLAVKADIREELDRLSAHAGAGKEMLAKGGPVGRELDFLAQELNREANTLCSKVQDMTLKRLGLDLKKTIDQLREQVQNIE